MTLRRHLRLAEPPPSWLLQGVLATTLLILLLDWATGPRVYLPVLVVLPVLLAAWFGRRILAFGLAIVLPHCAKGASRAVWKSPIGAPMANRCMC
ncbi:MAG TPA: hypothetical protein VFX76_09420 [Roseiflexaceae bacterium]|nr:hypothetical protein [Roseiflexaceae bacterium]